MCRRRRHRRRGTVRVPPDGRGSRRRPVRGSCRRCARAARGPRRTRSRRASRLRVRYDSDGRHAARSHACASGAAARCVGRLASAWMSSRRSYGCSSSSPPAATGRRRSATGASGSVTSCGEVGHGCGGVRERHRRHEELLETRLGRGLDLHRRREPPAPSRVGRCGEQGLDRARRRPRCRPSERRATDSRARARAPWRAAGRCGRRTPRRDGCRRSPDDPACSTSRSMPARRAALASWIARTSFWVTATRAVAPRRAARRRRCARPRRPGRRGRQLAPDHAVAVDDAGEEHLGDHLDDARTADAGDAGGRDGLAEVGSSYQVSTPITRKRGSSVSRIDADPSRSHRRWRAGRS